MSRWRDLNNVSCRFGRLRAIQLCTGRLGDSSLEKGAAYADLAVTVQANREMRYKDSNKCRL